MCLSDSDIVVRGFYRRRSPLNPFQLFWSSIVALNWMRRTGSIGSCDRVGLDGHLRRCSVQVVGRKKFVIVFWGDRRIRLA